jgi:DNA-binding response OmpR family regulator
MSKHILSVSYDQALLSTRQMLLQGAGYEVTSARGFHEAVESCRKGDFDLVVIGHSIPRKDKLALVQVTRMVSQAPVLSILRPTSAALAEADYSVKSEEGPQALLTAVHQALEQNRK